MSDIRVNAAQTTISRVTDGRLVQMRGMRDGSAIVAPWEMALVMEGKVFGANAGTITTGIAGHATADGDQPEIAIRAAADTLVVLPLYLEAVTQSFETTLGIHGVFWAISPTDVGNGTSTAFTPVQLNLSSSAAAAAVCRVAYTGNGAADPLTTTWYELTRAAGNFDSDAATSGILGLKAVYSSKNDAAVPILARTGCITGYGEGGTGANFFFTAKWAEFTQAEIE